MRNTAKLLVAARHPTRPRCPQEHDISDERMPAVPPTRVPLRGRVGRGGGLRRVVQAAAFAQVSQT